MCLARRKYSAGPGYSEQTPADAGVRHVVGVRRNRIVVHPPGGSMSCLGEVRGEGGSMLPGCSGGPGVSGHHRRFPRRTSLHGRRGIAPSVVAAVAIVALCLSACSNATTVVTNKGGAPRGHGDVHHGGQHRQRHRPLELGLRPHHRRRQGVLQLHQRPGRCRRPKAPAAYRRPKRRPGKPDHRRHRRPRARPVRATCSPSWEWARRSSPGRSTSPPGHTHVRLPGVHRLRGRPEPLRHVRL